MFNFIKWKAKTTVFLGKDKNSIMHLGVDTKGKPICMDSATLRNHILLTGSTGAGKTETLLSFMTNAFAWGSGGIFVDGKGDVSVYAKMCNIAEYFGRRDDLYVLNFMNVEFMKGLDGGLSHRFNPFAKAAADSVTQMIVSVVEDTGITMWKGRLTAMMTGLMRVLCWRRDKMGEPLDAAVIRDNISFSRMIDIANGVVLKGTPPEQLKAIRAYLQSVPGYVEKDGHSQSPTARDHHGYMEMQLAKTLSTMCDTYGHIFTAGVSDIDLEDVLFNRRFLLVMLPALEKSSDEIAGLGRIISASLKMMASASLGAPLEGTWDAHLSETTEIRKAPPFLCIMDEVNYYLVDGFDLMASQSRFLNIGMVFSCQSMATLLNSPRRVADTIISSTRTKIAMRSDGWQSNMDALFAGAEPGRGDVLPFLKKHIRSSGRKGVLPTVASITSDFEPGQFALMSSGKLVIGKAYYVDLPISRQTRLRLTRLRSVTAATEELMRIEQNHPPVVSTMTKLPDRLKNLCAEREELVEAGGIGMLVAAVASLSEAVHRPVETIRIGE